MEREANYAAVGAFVVLVVVMAALFVYWYSDARDHRDYARYEIYFSGSVSGLSRGAPVRYLGVDVGRVITMRIDSRNANRVQVIVDIDSSAPVTSSTVAQLSLQGDHLVMLGAEDASFDVEDLVVGPFGSTGLSARRVQRGEAQLHAGDFVVVGAEVLLPDGQGLPQHVFSFGIAALTEQ